MLRLLNTSSTSADGGLSLQYFWFVPPSIVVDIMRLAGLAKPHSGFWLLVLAQVLEMVCKVRTLSSAPQVLSHKGELACEEAAAPQVAGVYAAYELYTLSTNVGGEAVALNCLLVGNEMACGIRSQSFAH